MKKRKLYEDFEEYPETVFQATFGSYSERAILGLPPRGPLKIEDVKNAFRLSALKWHPDKHQGPSQAAAEEKFKSCVTAYKSLCSNNAMVSLIDLFLLFFYLTIHGFFSSSFRSQTHHS
ncbi:hypothetical protein K7X08_021652 [Anisodus acutangulus]|uniref:J domain-containing protein n=1 Tax=Anisodus acutangulus TaxID=402998 RepID=A0A9Q1M9J0_9SOLA|nr:hypothetical protein K7X08_021652 [Anisodus acutangulus]